MNIFTKSAAKFLLNSSGHTITDTIVTNKVNNMHCIIRRSFTINLVSIIERLVNNLNVQFAVFLLRRNTR